jgi:branched-chain amino acid transport system ATP-binding protein
MLLEVDHLAAGYGSSQVLFGLSLAIAPGEVVTLLGRNGMGKTSTVRCLSGLLPVKDGTITFAGSVPMRCDASHRPSRPRPGAGRPPRSQPHGGRIC